MLKKLLPCALLAVLYGCSNESKQNAQTFDPLFSNIDSTVKPGDDFFLYANGNWIKNNPIPAAESNWGIGNLVNEDLYVRMRTLNENAVKESSKAGSITQKIASFWTTAMDTVAIDKAGLAPLQTDLDRIDKAATTAELIKLAGEFLTKGAGSFFDLYIGQDDMNSEVMAINLYQGGLGMPSRDYYFETDEKTLAVRKAFEIYLQKTFAQLGNDAPIAAKNATSILQLETKLAKASRKLAELRDPYKNYNKMPLAKLQAIAPNLNWNDYFAAVTIKNPDSLIVGQPEFFAALSQELKTTPIEVWKNYLKYKFVSAYAEYLDNTTYMNAFAFRQTLSGATEPRPRWKRVLDEEESVLGEALGQLFVREYFNEEAKKRYEGLVENIRTALKERIEKLSWMSDSTKIRAYDKLTNMNKKVGYPEIWKDFSNMQIGNSSYVQNVQNASQWWHQYQVNKLGKPVDRNEWSMNPQEYNAYYNPANNEIVLPAGIFTVPGKRDAEIDDAFVYGYAAASTIGHEITHGFDDQGRQYDTQGNLKNWWTDGDALEFGKRAQSIINQYNEFIPVDTLHINGEATQGENIADLGGLLLGLDAFKKTETYKKGEKINGQSPLQRYFLGYAYSWMYSTKKERLATRVKTDVHSPAKERVNGVVVNVPEFYEAFGIKPSDKMYRPDSLRVSIW